MYQSGTVQEGGRVEGAAGTALGLGAAACAAFIFATRAMARSRGERESGGDSRTTIPGGRRGGATLFGASFLGVHVARRTKTSKKRRFMEGSVQRVRLNEWDESTLHPLHMAEVFMLAVVTSKA